MPCFCTEKTGLRQGNAHCAKGLLSLSDATLEVTVPASKRYRVYPEVASGDTAELKRPFRKESVPGVKWAAGLLSLIDAMLIVTAPASKQTESCPFGSLITRQIDGQTKHCVKQQFTTRVCEQLAHDEQHCMARNLFHSAVWLGQQIIG